MVFEFLFHFFLACFLSPGSRMKLTVPFSERFGRVPSLGDLKSLRGTEVMVLSCPHLIEESQVYLFWVVFLNFCLYFSVDGKLITLQGRPFYCWSVLTVPRFFFLFEPK